MRRRLAPRRRSLTLDLEHDGSRFAISIGYDAGGRAREVFIAGPKVGTGLKGILDDAAILMSIALQHGAEAAALPRSMGELGEGGSRASILGAIADLVASNAAIERDR